MAPLSQDRAKTLVESFLSRIRVWISERHLECARLPSWVTAARVRTGWVNESLVCVFEDSPTSDSHEVRGSVNADTAILLNIDDYVPTGASLRAKEPEGLIVITGTYNEEGRSILHLTGEAPALFDCGYAGYHGPRALLGVFMQHVPGGRGASPVAIRYIPFALYVHADDTTDADRLWGLCEQHLTGALLNIHNSDTGTYYERLQARAPTFALNKMSGVIVLGKDTGKELQELIQVRDYFRGKGYDAELIKDLPEIPMMSNEEKVRLWTLVSRFTVMVDRVPAGHLAEYMMLRGQRVILALLRQQGAGSTYMVGDDPMVDVNFVHLFEFGDTPLTVLNSVVDWAESITLKRTIAYDRAYPWRDSHHAG